MQLTLTDEQANHVFNALAEIGIDPFRATKAPGFTGLARKYLSQQCNKEQFQDAVRALDSASGGRLKALVPAVRPL